jgi:gliding motility-associated-like protein
MTMKRIIAIVILNFGLIHAQSSGGILSSDAIVCQANNSGMLSVSGYSGAIIRWEHSATSTGPWIPMFITTNAYSYTNLLQSTYFRVVVQLTGFPAVNSNTVLVSCDMPAIAGIMIAPASQCINTGFTANLTGYSGTIVSWESSINNWITTSTISTLNAPFMAISSITTTTQLRARVQNGVCPLVTSAPVSIIPVPPSAGGSVLGSATVCAASNVTTLGVSGYSGNIQHWESSSSASGPFNLIAGSAGNSNLLFANLNLDTWFRASVASGNCSAAYSSIHKVQVDAASSGGFITGPPSVCGSTNNGTLQLLAHHGNINFWEYSTNNGASWNSITSQNSVCAFSNVPSTRIYRAMIQNGVCTPASSNPFILNVNAVPIVTFNITNACAGSVVNFTNQTSGSNAYAWDLGDGFNATGYNVSHNYSAPGTYSVKLTVTNSGNCVDSAWKALVIFPRPVASWISGDTACLGNSILFINSSSISSGSINQSVFNFNDGSPISTSSTVVHIFTQSGTYPVKLLVTSSNGCKDSVIKQVSIYPKPSANFYASNVCKGSSVIFNNLSSINTGNLDYNWNYGDGFISGVPSPVYTYSNAGIYTVTLVAGSSHNCRDTSFKVIVINERPTVSLIAESACVGSAINFTSTISPPILPVTGSINFGDGSSSPQINVTHTYNTPGNYLSVITVITDSGCVVSLNKNISVYSRPFAGFYTGNSCSGDSVTFANTSSIANGSLKFNWEFDSRTSNVIQPTLTFTNPGVFNIKLTATSEYGCSDILVRPITIYSKPVADFVFNNACEGLPVSFTNKSTLTSGFLNENKWSFGDNTVSGILNPVKQYLNASTYAVMLVVSSNAGCHDTAVKNVTIQKAPVAIFAAANQCLNVPVVFANQTVLDSGNYTSQWQFGDSSSSSMHVPSHLYREPGLKKVWLKVISGENCADSVSRFLEIYPLPSISAGRDTMVEKGFGIMLSASGGTSFSWFPATDLSDPTVRNPYASAMQSNTYVVEGIDAYGCSNTDSVIVTVRDSLVIFPFNILTPDHNLKNDTWVIRNIQSYPANHVLIFDQWNQEVFSKDGYSNEWDGRNKSGEILPDGTYYYVLTFNDYKIRYRGFITLMRNAR